MKKLSLVLWILISIIIGVILQNDDEIVEFDYRGKHCAWSPVLKDKVMCEKTFGVEYIRDHDALRIAQMLLTHKDPE